MKKQFAKLPKAEQKKVEAEYHQMKSGDLDELMLLAKHHKPDLIRLPPRLVKKLKAMAESEGEREYQTMVRRWIEERLQQNIRLAG